ncbi:MAG TPA: hypothetical protein VGC76_17610 [Pyrinomonadaceae bacterium]|jgi:hypothetical protein
MAAEINREFGAPDDLGRWQTIALGVGGLATIVVLIFALIGAPEQKEQVLRSWLLGIIFWGGIGIGSIGILLLQYLTGGAWGVVSRRVLEAGSRTIPIIFILFIPILFGVTYLYEWTHPTPGDLTLEHRGWYLTPLWFIIRAVLYFVLWWIMQYLLNKWAHQQDAATTYEDSVGFLTRASRFSGPTIAIFVLVVSFASIDWVMTLDPHWYSTMWGFLFVAGWALSCFCFVVVILAALSDKAPMNRVLGKRHFHDIGKLMLALTMVWAYFNFSQFLIIWSGNLPEETVWYLVRMKGTWGVIGIILILFHFGFPFLVLLSRDIKRNAKYLAGLAIFILILRLVDMFYLIGPNPRVFEQGVKDNAFHMSWLDIVAPIAVGGIWLWWFFRELQKYPLVPINDPFLENAIEHGKGH